MQTLTPTTIIDWLNRLSQIEAVLVEARRATPDFNSGTWTNFYNAARSAAIIRGGLQRLSVGPVAVEVWDRESV
jgi:hypothetical protein